MKILIFSDLHCDLPQAKLLVHAAKQADLVIGAGDFANTRSGLARTLNALRGIVAPLVLVAGNSETDDELRAACASWNNAHVLHGETKTIAGIQVYGLGGAVPITPFGDWSFDLSEEDASPLLTAMSGAEIAVLHSPPWQVVDRDSRGTSRGSTAIRAAILQHSPKLAICGHIHGSAGTREMLGSTLVINAGKEGILLDWPLE